MIGAMVMHPRQSGPCVICGDIDYNLSCGGPTICPKCDCGNFDAATVQMQAKVISALRQEIERLRAAQPEYLSGCQLSGPGECQSLGQCQSQSCKHAGKVVRPRMCVEPKQDGILYPRIEK